MKAILIINDGQKLTKEQEDILNKEYESYKTFKVSPNGLTLNELKELELVFANNNMYYTKDEDEDVSDRSIQDIVFAHPVPYLIKALSNRLGYYGGQDDGIFIGGKVLVFHNDSKSKDKSNWILI